MNKAARQRYQTDPKFHHTVDLLSRVAIDAVDRGDRYHDAEETGWTRYEDVWMQVVEAICDTLGELDQQLGIQPEICYGTVYPHYFQGTRQS